MRCMTLAIAFTAFSWIALGTEIRADETPAIDISSSTSSRFSYVSLAADRQVAEVASPSDTSASPALSNATPGNANPPSNAAIPQDFSSVHGYRPPLPFGPSAPSAMLQYMVCDPHSCPNIWQGYEAQRRAELTKKCSPPGCGSCGAGCGFGGTNLYSSPCMTCSIGPRKVLNRYRPVSSPACSSCGKAGCDSISTESPGTNGCSSCQAAIKNEETDRLSAVPSPATTW